MLNTVITEHQSTHSKYVHLSFLHVFFDGQSNLMPCRFTFRTVDDKEYVTMFKHGDDLRQDQLVLQIITLMDRVSNASPLLNTRRERERLSLIMSWRL